MNVLPPLGMLEVLVATALFVIATGAAVLS